MTDADGVVISVGARNGQVYVRIYSATVVDLEIDEADELMAGIRRAQLIAAKQQAAEHEAERALAQLGVRRRGEHHG